jgi:predicted small secreted protein
MQRLAIFFAVLCASLLAACSSLGSAVMLGRDISFTGPQLQAQLDRKFPRDYRKLGGLVSISLLNPRLSLPGGGRLKLDFDIGVAGMGNASRNPSGHFALESGLRFDAGTRGLHLDNPEIVQVEVPALGGVMNDSARSMLNSWLLDYAREEPVYRLDDSAFGRIASRRIDRVDIDSGLITLKLD